jgi:hypothetical protein
MLVRGDAKSCVSTQYQWVQIVNFLSPIGVKLKNEFLLVHRNNAYLD